MTITARYGNLSPLAWRGILAVLAVALVAGGAALWYTLSDDGNSDTAATAGAVVHDGVIPVGAELGPPPVAAPQESVSVGLAAATTGTPAVYMVATEEQLRIMQFAEDEANAIRVSEGLGAVFSQFVIVAPADTGSFLAGLAEANAIRAAQGLPAFEVIDLR